jgi:hypothetical protein
MLIYRYHNSDAFFLLKTETPKCLILIDLDKKYYFLE